MSIALSAALVGIVSAAIGALIGIAGWWVRATGRAAKRLRIEEHVTELHQFVIPQPGQSGDSLVERSLSMRTEVAALQEQIRAMGLQLSQHINDEDIKLDAVRDELGVLQSRLAAMRDRLEEHLTFEEDALSDIKKRVANG